MNRSNYISQYSRINRKFETQYLPYVKKAIHFKVEQVIHALRSGSYDAAVKHLHSDIVNPAIAPVIQSLYKTVGVKHAQLNYSRLKSEIRRKFFPGGQEEKGFGFNAEWIAFVLSYLKRHLLDKVTIEINNTTRDALLRALSIMQMDGLSVDSAVDKLSDWPYELFQAARIVRTEVNRAANTGAMAQAETSPWQQNKEWIAIHDNRTRGNPITGLKDHANHWALDKVTIDEGDVFIDPRNGDRLDFPGDPKASAASTVNCRCSVAYHFKRDPKGNLIPKRKTTAVLFPNQIINPHTITI